MSSSEIKYKKVRWKYIDTVISNKKRNYDQWTLKSVSSRDPTNEKEDGAYLTMINGHKIIWLPNKQMGTFDADYKLKRVDVRKVLKETVHNIYFL